MSYQQESEDQKKVKGEISKSNIPRNFGCPCGKTYLSYPALFTHVKQKHGGKAPGTLIKPKNQKSRGRPRLNSINNESDNQDSQIDYRQEVIRIIDGASIQKAFKFQQSEGKKTCNDMASHFLKQFNLNQTEMNSLKCFISYLNFFIDLHYGTGYWSHNSPNEIIDISNDMIKSFNTHADNFPLSKQQMKQLTYVLFKWMYKNKWTDHKLIRKTSEVSL